jgi:hypothetical protein
MSAALLLTMADELDRAAIAKAEQQACAQRNAANPAQPAGLAAQRREHAANLARTADQYRARAQACRAGAAALQAQEGPCRS